MLRCLFLLVPCVRDLRLRGETLTGVAQSSHRNDHLHAETT
jgi:hypothetical protein